MPSDKHLHGSSEGGQSKLGNRVVSSSEEPVPVSSEEDPWAEPERPPRESCVKHFDQLWFCYSPVFQMQQLYRYGEMDNCQGHWKQLWQCLQKRTKFANQVVEEPKQSLWHLRSPEEAAQWWKKEFGRLLTAESLQSDSPADPP